MTDPTFFAHVALVAMLGLIALTRRDMTNQWWYRVTAFVLFLHIVYTDMTVVKTEPLFQTQSTPQEDTEPTQKRHGEFWQQMTQDAPNPSEPLVYTRNYSFT